MLAWSCAHVQLSRGARSVALKGSSRAGHRKPAARQLMQEGSSSKPSGPQPPPTTVTTVPATQEPPPTSAANASTAATSPASAAAVNATKDATNTNVSNRGSSNAAGSFPGFPSSAGMLAPELQPLLVAIQEAHLYNDSKTAVDLVLKGPLSQVAAAYKQLLPAGQAAGSGSSDGSSGDGGSSVNRTALQTFVDQYLDPAGSDLELCQQPDWQPEPPNFLINLISGTNSSANSSSGGGGSSNAAAPQLRQFGLDVHALWRVLCRQVSPDVLANPERHSLLPLANRTVVPGDRFRETYYWDSYWVLRGLLVSGMRDTAARLLSNLLQLLEAVGHVPNGARVYYLNRSQPPLLSAMVRLVAEAGGPTPPPDTQLLARALPLLLQEHRYWTSPPKAVTVTAQDGTQHNLSRYWADWFQPRPESYREDSELAVNVTGTSSPSDPSAAQLYHELASGAESGWDYSSRWFSDGQNLSTIRTIQLVPADLNAWLYQMERNIAWMANATGDTATSQAFNDAAAARKAAIQALLWDEGAGMWRDGVLSPASNATTNSSSNTSSSGNSERPGTQQQQQQAYTLTHNPGLFASNFVPLWAGLTEGNESQGSRVVEALQSSALIGPSGIATTATRTGQQWDYPNGWPPLQHMLIEGASRYGGGAGDDFAGRMARTWVMMNMHVFYVTGHMHEKYDVSGSVSDPSSLVGGGGEYTPQVGFGWSNGVVLDLLATYF